MNMMISYQELVRTFLNSFIAIPCSDYFPKGQEPRRKVASQDRAARVMPDAYWLNFSSFFDMKDSGKATGEGREV